MSEAVAQPQHGPAARLRATIEGEVTGELGRIEFDVGIGALGERVVQHQGEIVGLGVRRADKRILGDVPVVAADVQLRCQLVGCTHEQHGALADVGRGRRERHVGGREAGGVGAAGHRRHRSIELVVGIGGMQIPRAFGVGHTDQVLLDLATGGLLNLLIRTRDGKRPHGVAQQAADGLVRNAGDSLTGTGLQFDAQAAELGKVLDHIALTCPQRHTQLRLERLDVGRVAEGRKRAGVGVEQDVVLAAEPDLAEVRRLETDPDLAPEIGRRDGAGVGVQPMLHVRDGLQTAAHVLGDVHAQATLGHATRHQLFLGLARVGVGGVAHRRVDNTIQADAGLGPGRRGACGQCGDGQCYFFHHLVSCYRM
mmetsp:Transcript_9617/g.22296  ORF Transcript_9617/g.22296 Transcript_9617/m.22296 type:complete len:367 (-) Transcript_9617:4571-5671(-)